MKMISKTLLICSAASLAFAGTAAAKVTTGDIAPDIQAVDSNGDVRSLSEFKGETVILEWTNHDCPYVKKHYGSNNMQTLQARAKADGAVWLSVISSAPGKQGHVDGPAANALTESRGASPTAVLLDEAGTAGRAYAAKTTPHMYVVTADGKLAYQGAIDDNPSARASTIPGATNYVTAALDAIAAGQPIEVTESQPYGCFVKY